MLHGFFWMIWAIEDSFVIQVPNDAKLLFWIVAIIMFVMYHTADDSNKKITRTIRVSVEPVIEAPKD